ncbi:MAG: hypothetical protein J6S69_06570 [Proteobacteria bacterium]|nr:hypothetical protein [Pseudomonadota bacterium]
MPSCHAEVSHSDMNYDFLSSFFERLQNDLSIFDDTIHDVFYGFFIFDTSILINERIAETTPFVMI